MLTSAVTPFDDAMSMLKVKSASLAQAETSTGVEAVLVPENVCRVASTMGVFMLSFRLT